MIPKTPTPDFRSPEFLRAHIADTMAFYHPRAIDPDGGFFHYFKDDGTVYDRTHRHLVSSTRFVYDYAMAAREYDSPEYLEAAAHGLRYLRDVHRDKDGGYAWTIRDGVPEDRTRHAYGMAFVMLAYATAIKAGMQEARPWLQETWDTLEGRFWESEIGLYRDEADQDWRFSPYRGQNSNMHLCEALIAAFEATANQRYLARALLVADHMTRRQAALAGGLVWEHYDQGWEVDWNYHRDDPKHLFRPWGFQPGHQTEWAKLLLLIEQHSGGPGVAPEWLADTARVLFDTALAHAWDKEFGGIQYGFAPTGQVCDDEKYFWVQAESLVAAWLLGAHTGDAAYAEWYRTLWDYSWTHLVDHEQGAWFRVLDRQNRKVDDDKSPAGKTDYHTMGACHELLRQIRGHEPETTRL